MAYHTKQPVTERVLVRHTHSSVSDFSCYIILTYKTWGRARRPWGGEGPNTPSWLICSLSHRWVHRPGLTIPGWVSSPTETVTAILTIQSGKGDAAISCKYSSNTPILLSPQFHQLLYLFLQSPLEPHQQMSVLQRSPEIFWSAGGLLRTLKPSLLRG